MMLNKRLAKGLCRASESSRSGLAMVAVILVLMALFVMSAPFLLTVRNADQASARIADGASSRIALEAATRHARHSLGASHVGADPTPYHDSLDEVSVSNRFDKDFLDANDTGGVMWDLDVRDLAGYIDLNSAPPQLLANLTGGVGHLRAKLASDASELAMHGARGFDPEGLVWVQGELMSYAKNDGGVLSGLTRGLQVLLDSEGEVYPCGPRPADDRELGLLVLDERAMAMARWRIRGDGPELERFAALDEASGASLGMLDALNIATETAWSAYTTLLRTATVYGDIGAGPVWQRGSRLVAKVDGGPQDGCILELDDARWFNPGTTVRIRDGESTEFGIVRQSSPRGIVLYSPLVNDYFPFAAVVEPLARRPVNVNTASPEVLRALVLNLRLRGRSSRISSTKADQLVQVMIESRPFEGLEDYVERIVLPAAGLEELPKDAPVVPEVFAPSDAALDGGSGGSGGGFLTQEDAVALYKNALNANDGELGFSTAPFSFTTRDVYAMDLRSSVNAKSGVERVTAARDSVELVVPQRPLMRVWGRQEDFDSALRLERRAKGWVSGPEATSRHDGFFGSDPPTRSRAHLGVHDSNPSIDPLAEEPTFTFASREEDGWAQLAASRADEIGSDVSEREGKVLHFDSETADPEGRYLPDGAIDLPLDGPIVDWIDDAGLLRPIAFEMWVKPRSLEDGTLLLDLGARYPDIDRVSLLFDQGDLVLRVIDGAGDHPDTTMPEYGEARYSLSGTGPGMPVDTWIHVRGDVRGNRPDQITLMVDGRFNARTPGMTKLTSGLDPGAEVISVESTEGFPDEPCTLRIGNELIEAVKTSETSFRATFETTGANAGFGGRQAREIFEEQYEPRVSTALLNTTKDLDHPVGSTVSLYGYSLPLRSNVPPVEGSLNAPLGIFAAGRVTGIVAGSDKIGPQMEPVNVAAGLLTINVGFGMDSQDNDVEGLILEPADAGMDITDAFQADGGYALLLGIQATISSTQPGGGTTNTDENGIRLGGMEIIHYTSWDGSHLMFDRRGDSVPELLRPLTANANTLPILAGRGAWVFEWANVQVGNQDPNELLTWHTKVIPISLGVRGGGGTFGFPAPTPGESEFVQLTPLSANEAHLTEWVRYDEVVGNQLVRSEPEALDEAYDAAQAGNPTGSLTSIQPNTPPGGISQQNRVLPVPPAAPSRIGPTTPGMMRSAPQAGGNYWQPIMGEREDTDNVVSKSIGSFLQFRGVLGTYSHAHSPGGTRVLPVMHMPDNGENAGWPGRFDRTFLMEYDSDTLGWPVTVQRAHRPYEYRVHSWIEDQSTPLGAQPGTVGPSPQTPFLRGRIYFALAESSPAAIAAGTATPGAANYEPRQWGRITKFPSGERPREAQLFRIGGEHEGGGNVPSALVDEVSFETTVFGEIDGSPGPHGAQLYLEDALSAGVQDCNLVDNAVRTTVSFSTTQARFLSRLAPDAGLIRIGEEIACYDSFDEGSFRLNFAPGGRGLLGSEEDAHAQGSPVTFLNTVRVTTLAAGVGASDAMLPITDTDGFPESGLVLIENELIHYTWLDGQGLGMPVSSLIPGAMDHDGGGIFRGRFGTEPAGHPGGVPVILMPFRYADHWAERADAPELSFFGLSMQQPGAYWQSSFFDVENPAQGGPRLGVLQRSDPSVPWDADPDRTERIDIHWDGIKNGEGNPVGDQSDQIDWRVFVEYENGSYDPIDGLSHGWKTTPRLRFLGVEYLGPGRVLSRIER